MSLCTNPLSEVPLDSGLRVGGAVIPHGCLGIAEQVLYTPVAYLERRNNQCPKICLDKEPPVVSGSEASGTKSSENCPTEVSIHVAQQGGEDGQTKIHKKRSLL